MGPLDSLFGQIKNAIEQHASPNTPGPSYDANGILGQLAGLFGQNAPGMGQQFDPQNHGYGQGIASSDEDPYGDPGAQQGQLASQGGYGNIASSDEDPYGDPGAPGGPGEIASSDEDPYGDPGAQR